MKKKRENIEIKDFTPDDIHDVVWGIKKPGAVAPENMSRQSTISGTVNAAKKYSGDLKRFL